MSAEILRLSDYRMDDGADREIDLGAAIDLDAGLGADLDPSIDLATAVDVAIRDLREILTCWGSEIARQRAQECESTLRRAYCGFIDDQTASQ